MTLVVDIATILASVGIGTTGTDLFYSQMPPSPDDSVCAYQYAGSPSLPEGISQPGVQVRIRNSDYVTGAAKAKAVHDALHGYANTLLNGTYYLQIFANQYPEALGVDDNDRHIFVVNFRVMMR